MRLSQVLAHVWSYKLSVTTLKGRSWCSAEVITQTGGPVCKPTVTEDSTAVRRVPRTFPDFTASVRAWIRGDARGNHMNVFPGFTLGKC